MSPAVPCDNFYTHHVITLVNNILYAAFDLYNIYFRKSLKSANGANTFPVSRKVIFTFPGFFTDVLNIKLCKNMNVCCERYNQLYMLQKVKIIYCRQGLYTATRPEFFGTMDIAPRHRVGRVLSFFFSRRNWDSPNPSSAGECAPPPGYGGRGTLTGERGVGRVPIPTRGTYTVVLFIYTYFVPHDK